ncbi:acyl-CoA N-acyltransferase, partial [Mycena polygramma]
PSEHAEAFFAIAVPHPELFTYLPAGPFATASDFVSTVFERHVQPNRGIVLFAVFDTTTPDAPQLAGMIGLFNTSAANLSTEIGFVITLPHLQRTHVTTNAAGLLLHWTLDAPADGGLGLRRVAWKANSNNARSVRVAERLGFRREGVLRWDLVLPEWKGETGNGGGVRTGDSMPGCTGRDTVVLSLCWDDWEGGARGLVDGLMQR